MATKKAVKKITGLPLQDTFFAQLRQMVPAGIGLAEEIASLLDVSTDSAYRRLRGETSLTLDEVARIAAKYPLSVDSVIGNGGGTATFNYVKLTGQERSFVDYFSRIRDQLVVIGRAKEKHIYYIADEAPLFYSFGSRRLAAFKLFFWQRSVLNIDRFQTMQFDLSSVPDELLDCVHECYERYMEIPSTEIWTTETVLTNLKQIRFYFDSGIITAASAIELLADYRDLIEKVHAMAKEGRKNVSDALSTYTLYSTDLVLGTNCILVKAGMSRLSYISFNSVNSLTTANSDFCDETESWIRSLERKSTIISGVAERERFRFFSGMLRIVDEYIAAIGA